MIKVKLSEIVDALEMQFDESQVYLDRAGGELIYLTDEDIQAAEDEEPLESYPQWQHASIQQARLILCSDIANFPTLPGKWEIDEYDIMRRFVETIEDEEMADKLGNAMHGSGAFRRFKERIHEYGIQNQWHDYRSNALRQIAIEWCREQQVEYSDDAAG